MNDRPAAPPAPAPARASARRPAVHSRFRGLRAAAFDARCLAMLAVMRIALSTIGYAAIRRRMPRPGGRPDSHFWARQVARRIERLARFVPGASCLTQALTLQFVLARRGHASRLQIGVRKRFDGAFSAHAWVTCNDRVVLGQRGTQLADFTPIAELG
ncbi:lasso peptide biosynthesis B2 protein [Erythrobacter sp.]|uniref:lasso peptide biosynthesis B2 protein n=1 Tax=Erythrobacter sp. TaxID=1042 RepID=UPI0025EF7FB5|nr:lasso peptide biosynthesis B2 protein [Erythrobacter sp.]